MGKLRSKKFRSLTEKLQKSLTLSTRDVVPEDVKEGHFVVHAINGDELQRFVIELGYLTHPEFLRLLDQAEEEFGFKQAGALVVPCHPVDLERILEKRRVGYPGISDSSRAI